ncbi:hypothetical protein SAMN04488128_103796 [Chitinophaga eiseniae]|uniref:Lipocalin-like domain-containing protein n=1 Tax=Chitinophaga eiseniae TaxID=634771 RepID=A0A1T4SYP5_9BACT|nr:hypothetical protein [Chitinophaga eiseniae]SKA33242.1 hypothetical protein SAMN04488128_103796 [Chitinophaga eiseniae]
MNHVKAIVIIGLSFFSLSCNKEREKLEGWWAIDEITMNGQDRRLDLSINTLTFENDGSCRLPKLLFAGKKEGEWKLEKVKGELFLTITSEQNAVAGIYQVIFFNDPKKKLYRMSLQSDNIQMVCSKMLQTYRE